MKMQEIALEGLPQAPTGLYHVPMYLGHHACCLRRPCVCFHAPRRPTTG